MEAIHLANPIEGSAPYLSLAAILILLILFDLFRGRKVIRHGGFLLLCLISLMFLASRIIALASKEAVFGGWFFPDAVFGALSLVSFAGVAFVLSKFRYKDRSNEDVVGSGLEDLHDVCVMWKLLRQTGYFAGAGGLVYLLSTWQSSKEFTAAGTVNTLLIAATLRPLVFLYQEIFRAGFEKRREFIIPLLLITVSTLSAFAVNMFPDKAGILDRLMMTADILLLISVLLVLQSHNLRIGLSYKNESDANREKMEKAKGELTRLSQIASEVYEDNNNLIKRQKEQTLSLTKRVENLEKLFQIGVTIQKRKNLDDLLQMIVELVRENLGFNTVILRLLNERKQSFETRAHVGLDEEIKETVLNYCMPLTDYRKMIEAKHRVSNSYFLHNSSQSQNDDSKEEGSVLVDNAWGDIDLLVVPLTDEGKYTIGYLSVENPENAKVSIADVIENLEMIASLAVIAIRNANLFMELESKNEKLKLYAAKLAGLNKMKANFVATVSHEFRTPLTSIKAYCETLLRSAEEVDRKILKEFLLVIDEESNRLMGLIEDILDFSQMESGAIKFERMPCSINETITSAVKELEKNFQQKNIALHLVLPEPEVIIRAERELIKQLMINLLHNASKFTQEGGNVWVKLEDETVSARIVVSDDGIGIPEDQIEKIFDRFHQVDASSTRKHGGSGLGLAICKNIVDWHDGRIWVENYSTEGARFTVVLPKKQVIVNPQVLSLGKAVQRFEVERYMELLIEIVAELIGAKRVSIMLLDREKTELHIECAIGIDEEVVEHTKLKLGEGIAGKVLQDGSSYLVEDIENDPRIGRKNKDFLYESKSFLCVPVKEGENTIGVVNVTSHISKEKFDEEDHKLLEIFSDRIGIALGKLYKYAYYSMDFSDVRDTFKAILDMNRYIDVHDAEGITELVMKVARKLGLNEESMAKLRYIFSVYDLGLSRVGYNVIKKPVELSPEDRKSVEQHSIYGNDMLKAIEAVPEVRDAVLYHHENFDGTGYPERLSGEAIPIEARIIRVADSLKALQSHRPYQKKYTKEEAMEVLKHRSGTFFDPEIVDVFLETIEETTPMFSKKGDETEKEIKKEPV